MISKSIFPSPSTSAKSLTLLNSLFAILGVPRLRLASSWAASSVIGQSRTKGSTIIKGTTLKITVAVKPTVKEQPKVEEKENNKEETTNTDTANSNTEGE